MKTSRVRFLLVIAGLLALLAAAPIALSVDNQEGTGVSAATAASRDFKFTPRPAIVGRALDLAPGESNKVLSPLAANPVTTDLNSVTPTDLANALAGPGVTVSSVIYLGDNTQAGLFSAGTGIIGFESGVILGTGNIASVRGPDNTFDDVTTIFGAVDCDAELATVTGNAADSLNDCASLQFDSAGVTKGENDTPA